MSVFVGITSFNTCEYLENCLRSLLRPEYSVPDRIHVVDNGSTDGTLEMLHGMAGDRITYEKPGTNTLASGGTRRSVDRFMAEDADMFLHLDADTEMRGDAVGSFVRQIGNRDDAVVGVQIDKLMYQHPKARSLKQFDSYIFGEWKKRHAPDMGENEFKRRMVKTAKIGQVYRELCGWFLGMPRAVIEAIGNVDDERYGMWRWESEWVLRASVRGFHIEHALAVEEGLVHHFGGRSRQRQKDSERYSRMARSDLAE